MLSESWPSLQKLEVTCFEDEGRSQVLETLPVSLQELDLYGFELGDSGVRQLARTALPNLRRMRLAGAGFTREGLREFWEAPFLAGLASLDLSGNGLISPDIPEFLLSKVRL